MAFVGGGAIIALIAFLFPDAGPLPAPPPCQIKSKRGTFTLFCINIFIADFEDIFDKFFLNKRFVWMGDGSWRWLLQFNVNEGLSDLAQPTSALIRKVSPEYSVVMSFSGAGGTRHHGFYAYKFPFANLRGERLADGGLCCQINVNEGLVLLLVLVLAPTRIPQTPNVAPD